MEQSPLVTILDEQPARAPSWALELPQPPLRAMLLIGAYSPTIDADAQILIDLGSDLQAVQALSTSLNEQPGARLLHSHFRWHSFDEPAEHIAWEQPRTAWELLAPVLAADDLNRFASVVGKALLSARTGEALPTTNTVSKLARIGLTRSLALLGNSDDLILVTPAPSARAADIVGDLLGAPADRWSTLAEYLPLLAEAAPETFLAALADSLAAAQIGISNLADKNPQVIKQAAGALAVLALDVDLLERAALALAGLAAHGEKPRPNIRDSHPLHCLEGILNYHYPKTNAPIDERLAVLRKICEQYPLVAWPLLIDMLPGQRMMALDLPLPQVLRISVPPRNRQVYAGEAYGQVQTFLTLAMELAGSDATRWAELVAHLRMLPPDLELTVLVRLNAAAEHLQDTEAGLWAALRTRLHVVVSPNEPDEPTEATPDPQEGAERQLRDRVHALYERLYQQLTPANLALRGAWLFSNLSRPPGRYRSIEEEDREQSEMQRSFLLELGQRPDRWELLSELSRRVGEPFWLARTLAASEWAPEFETKLLELETLDRYQAIAASFLAWRLVQRDFSDTESLLRRWVREHRHADFFQLALALTGTAGEREARLWDLLDDLGEPVRNSYWRQLPVEKLYTHNPRTIESVERAIRCLMVSEQLDVAMRAAIVLKPAPSSALMLDVLEKVAQRHQEQERARKSERDQLRQLNDLPREVEHIFSSSRRSDEDQHLVAELLTRFQPADAAEVERARQLEQAALSLLQDTHHYQLRWLPTYLGDHPEAFAELAQSEESDDLLDLWDGFPGDQLAPERSQSFLSDWSRSVLELLPRDERPQSGHRALARLLVRPTGSDGLWPSKVVRELLQEYPYLHRVFLRAKQYPGGGRMRRVSDIVQEARELAVRCRLASSQLRTCWPATARLLDELAQSYDQEVDAHRRRDEVDLQRDQMTSPQGPIRPLFPLQRVQIENFRATEKMVLTLHPRLTILYGRNGSGKTTLLDAIAIGLSAVARRLPLATVDSDQRLPRFLEADRHTTWQAGKKALKAKRVSVSLWGQPSDQRSASLHWWVENRWASRGPEITDRESPQLQPYLDAVKEALRTSDDNVPMPVFAYYGIDRSVSDQAKEDARPTKDEQSRPAGLDGALRGKADFENAVQWFRSQEDIEIRRQREDPQYVSPALAAVRTAISAAVKTPDGIEIRNPRIDAQLSKLILDFVRRDGTVEELEIGQLSDGFRTLLALVMDLARRMVQCNPSPDVLVEHDGFGLRSYAVILIDQVDQNLHAGWQKTVLSDLLTAFPNAQFIVTTHSALVLGSAKNAQIISLQSGEQETVSGLFGKTPNTILRDYQGITPRDKETQDAIDAAIALVDEEKFADARTKIEQMAAQLGEDDGDVVHLRTLVYFADPPIPPVDQSSSGPARS